MVPKQGNRTPILDHGYIEVVESWGTDERIIEAARMSTSKGFLGWAPEIRYECAECEYTFFDNQPVDRAIDCQANPAHGRMFYKLVHHGDEKLLRFLWKNHHHTPFEMAGATFEIQAPIFVFREWHRHRTQSYNELSARYTPLPDVNYIPTVERLLMSGGANKQSQGTGNVLDVCLARTFQQMLQSAYANAQNGYEAALGWGVPKELARCLLPVGRYSRMRASANLRNWLHFLTLRMDDSAQWEIRQYANAVAEVLTTAFPRTMALFQEGASR